MNERRRIALELFRERSDALPPRRHRKKRHRGCRASGTQPPSSTLIILAVTNQRSTMTKRPTSATLTSRPLHFTHGDKYAKRLWSDSSEEPRARTLPGPHQEPGSAEPARRFERDGRLSE
jgi:hypothetical protein